MRTKEKREEPVSPLGSAPFKQIPISLLTLRFHRNTLNQGFAEWIREARILQIRLAFLLVSILYVLYGITEPYFAPGETLSVAQLLHIGLIAPITFVIALYPSSRFLKKHFQPLAILATFIAYICYLYLVGKTGLSGSYTPELYFMILWIFTVAGFRFYLATAFSLLLIALALFNALQLETTAVLFYTYCFWLFIAFCLAFLGGHLLEYWSRVHYFNTLTLHNEITDRKAVQDQLKYLSEHDPLTGLSNRIKLSKQLDNAIDSAQKRGEKLAWIFIDIDGFKHFNDTEGHIRGDALLKAIAKRLVSSVRENDIIGRIGGDEFIVLLTHIKETEDALSIAEHIRISLAEPYRLDSEKKTYNTSASLGIALFPEHGNNEMSLSKCADAAMYQSKRKGRNQVSLWC